LDCKFVKLFHFSCVSFSFNKDSTSKKTTSNAQSASRENHLIPVSNKKR
jgi:hypothetical protein